MSTNPVIDRYGNKRWYNKEGQLHRLDGPAIECNDGTKFWYQNGKYHRLDGPAVEWSEGSKEWYQNDKRHRLDGPAIEYSNGSKAYYINEKELTEEEFDQYNKQEVKMSTNSVIDKYGDKQWFNKEGKLHRIGGPAIEQSNGTKFWYQDGKRHRLDGPAAEWSDGAKQWYQNNELHRVDGPAIESNDGYKAWCQNDKRHRLDGPAIEYIDGTKEYYIDGKELTEEEFNQHNKQKVKMSTNPVVGENGNKLWYNKEGQLHRVDGPAIERCDGGKVYYQNGKLHRINGPAIEWSRGNVEYYINDQKLTEEEFNQHNKQEVKMSTNPVVDKYGTKRWFNKEGQYHRIDEPAIEYNDGGKLWYQNGKKHRLDGPAIEWSSGHKYWYINDKRHRVDGPAIEGNDKSWYQNDQLHRLDGPAVECNDGSKSWHQNGKLHRIDGPAVEYNNGSKAYFIDGKHLTKEEFNQHNKQEVKMFTNPVVDKYGAKRWYNEEGQLHRVGGPALEGNDKVWYQNGEPHRVDGPAIEYSNGSKAYFIDGKQLTKEEFNKRNSTMTPSELIKALYEDRKCITKNESQTYMVLNSSNSIIEHNKETGSSLRLVPDTEVVAAIHNADKFKCYDPVIVSVNDNSNSDSSRVVMIEIVYDDGNVLSFVPVKK